MARHSCCECLSARWARANLLALAAFVLALFAFPPARAQNAPVAPAAQDQEPGLVLERTVRRVVVDVVVTDDHGHPVPGLTAADFHLFEDGKPQSIRQFDVHSPSEAVALPARPAVLPANTFVDLPASPQALQQPLTVILFDALNTPLREQIYARQQMLKFLEQMPIGSQTAIFVLSDRLHLLQGFSGEREVLVAAAKHQGPVPDKMGLLPPTDENGAPTSPLSAQAQSGTMPAGVTGPGYVPGAGAIGVPGGPLPLNGPMSANMLMQQMADEVSSALLDRRVDVTLAALQQIARFLSSVPGRKNLIWLSSSFPASVAPDESAGTAAFENQRSYNQQIVDTDNLLCMSQVAVYPVDARGLAAPILRSGPGTAQDYAANLAATQGTMDQVADETGGHAFYNSNELVRAFNTAIDNGSNYYSLTYAPTNPNFDGRLRHIKLVVDHSGYHLAYRRSYYADDAGMHPNLPEDLAVAAPDPGSLLSALQFGAPLSHQIVFAARVNAVGSPVQASDKQMASLMPFLQIAARNEGVNFDKPKSPLPVQRYTVQFGVMARQLEMTPGSDGKFHPQLAFGVMAFDAAGNPLGGEQTSVDASVSAAQMPKLMKEGYQALQTIYVPLNAASLRVAVRDNRSNRLGSVEVPLPIEGAAQGGASR